MVIDERRLRIYEIAYLLCLLLAAGTSGQHDMLYWLVVAPCLATMVLALLVATSVPQAAKTWAVVLSSLMVAGWPLASAAGPTGATAWRDAAPLLAAAVSMLGSRVLVARSDLRYRTFWRGRDVAAGAVQRQSALAAVLLGVAFAEIFYLLFDLFRPQSPDPALGIIFSALGGATVIHHAIIILFFIILAWIVDAVLLHLADRAAATRYIASARTSARQASAVLAEEGHRAVLQLMAEAARDAPAGSGDDAVAALRFEQAARGFVRSLVPLLPLLGFLGTVIGLARAIADLHLGTDGGAADFAGTLSGLAIKFETTLLGLMASMIASLLLSLLDKRETEFSAECVLASKRLADAQKAAG